MKHAVDLEKYYSFADYLTWNDDERREIIEGKIFDMSPAPDRHHQAISMKLSVVFGTYLKNRKCRVFAAPFDVRLYNKPVKNDKDIDTVVQPDIVIVCDEKKLDNRGCIGSPDMVIEILSPSSSGKDIFEKLPLYEKYGIVDCRELFSE